jgi:hypothetical protein
MAGRRYSFHGRPVAKNEGLCRQRNYTEQLSAATKLKQSRFGMNDTPTAETVTRVASGLRRQVSVVFA